MVPNPRLLSEPVVNAQKTTLATWVATLCFYPNISPPKTMKFSKAGPICPGPFPLSNHDYYTCVFIYPTWVEPSFSHPILATFHLFLFLSLKCSRHAVWHVGHSTGMGQDSVLCCDRHKRTYHASPCNATKSPANKSSENNTTMLEICSLHLYQLPTCLLLLSST